MTSAVGPASWALAWTAGLLLAGILAIVASDALSPVAWAVAPPAALTLLALSCLARGVWRDHLDVHRGGVGTRLVAAVALAGFWLVASAAAATGWSLFASILAGTCLWVGGVTAGLRALGRARALAMAILAVSGALAWVILAHLPQLLGAGMPDVDLSGSRLGAAAAVGGCAVVLGVLADLVRDVTAYRDDHTASGLGLILAGAAGVLLVTAGVPATTPSAAPLPGLLAAAGGLVLSVAALIGGGRLLRHAPEASGDGLCLLAVALGVVAVGGVVASLGPDGHPLAVKVLLGGVATLTGALAGLFGARPFLRGGREGLRALAASIRRHRAA